MFPRNLTRITTSVLRNSPYNFDVIWSKSNYMLVEMIPKPPPPGKIPDYDMEAQIRPNLELYEIREISHPRRDEKVASLNNKGYF
tara:strand:+ start:87 stop:341 length:255 start_codon:yes stop_codon:yes gene_type:complete